MRVGREQRGVALTVAMFAIVLIGIFSAVLASAAVELSDTSTEDRDEKRALQAAQAGLSTAFHRLNAQGNVQTPNLLDLAQLGIHLQCVGLNPVNALLGLNECPRPGQGGADEGQGTAGTGTRFRYTVTPVLSGDDCGDAFVPTSQTLLNNLLTTLTDLVDQAILRGPGNDEDPLYIFRCITSIGETVGPDGAVTASARLQERVGSPFGIVANIVGTEEVVVDAGIVLRPLGNVLNSAAGVIGTNGKVRIRNGGLVYTDVSHPDPSSNPVEGSGHLGNVVQHSQDWFLPRVSGGDLSTPHNNGWTVCLNINLLLVQFDGCDYSSSRRELSIHGLNVLGIATTNAVTLRPGIHVYCKVSIEGGLLPTIVTMVQSRILITPDVCPSSVPPAERGTLRIDGQVLFLDLNQIQPYSGFYVEGDPGGGVPGVRIDGSGLLPTQIIQTAIYAPETTVEIRDAAKVLGAYYGRRVEFKTGATYASLPVLGSLKLNLLGAVQQEYARYGFVQCRANPPDPNDQESC